MRCERPRPLPSTAQSSSTPCFLGDAMQSRDVAQLKAAIREAEGVLTEGDLAGRRCTRSRPWRERCCRQRFGATTEKRRDGLPAPAASCCGRPGAEVVDMNCLGMVGIDAASFEAG